ncbi:uncharacterized protein LOC117500165 [Trematomus bernacchii]|uniref:uncharacterized protein LOC117500165 n=1 Tax=Trematomus bernacchii TaxID=40690 RepID=UPI00146B7571|nr:uncharacterized protein LOC117500165 [Trematomus bernacchii]
MKLFVLLLLVVYELYLCESKGISAGTVFVLKGEDVLLNVTAADDLQDVSSFSWTFNETKKNVLTVNPGNNPYVFTDYAERIEFSVNNYSVKLKNLQEADSGVYSAVVTNRSGDETEAAKYKIKVQDRASLPLLTVSSVSDSSPSCSFTVTCSSQDSHINSTFTCETRTCSQEGGERSEGIPDTFLQVHQSSGSIICNHSNHVSWTNTTKIIKDVCPKHFDSQPTNPVPIILGVFFTILTIIGVVLWYLRKNKQRSEWRNSSLCFCSVPGPAAHIPGCAACSFKALGPTNLMHRDASL